jgi:oligoendopeptidase F
MPDASAPATPAPGSEPAPALLPDWDLADLYPSPDSPQISADLDAADTAAEAFSRSQTGRIAECSGTALAAAIEEYERIVEALERVMAYAQLLFAGDATKPEVGRFYQQMTERVTAISSRLLFFPLELNMLDEAILEEKLTEPRLARWQPWLRDQRVFRPHQLSEELERLLHEKEVSGAAAWSRLFDEEIAAMRIVVRGEELGMSGALNLLSDRDRSVREAAGHAVADALKSRLRLFSLVTNTLAKDKQIVDSWRHYPQPCSYRNRANMVEDAVVEALVAAVEESYPRLAHRYYALKAKWLGLPKLQYWDRNAPLPDDDDREIPWPEAKERVLAAYAAFSPTLASIGQQFFDRPWIDAKPRPGKASGAFAHPTVPSAHPYLLLNYHGRARDVMTLAHELGHGVHQVLAGPQGCLMAGTPLTLAETASVFGEMLTFRSLLADERKPERRRILLAAKVEDMLNTVVRQIAFHRFETLLHEERRTGEVLAERIGALWMEIQAASLGPAFEFAPEYSLFWSYVPHFIHAPFYVYAYAFGDCLVNTLYSVYQSGQVTDFEAKYLAMLQAGGTLRHRELLAPFGLDAADPGFWRRGLDVIAGFIDSLEEQG